LHYGVLSLVEFSLLIVTNLSFSSTTGIEYYMVTDGKTTSDGWYNADLFKRLNDIRAERLEEIRIKD
jgi:hypothetical protein